MYWSALCLTLYLYGFDSPGSVPFKLRQCKLAGGGAKTYLRNKAAQVFSLVFVTDFPDRWPTFLLDLMTLSQLGPPAVDAFLRTLLQIDQEVGQEDRWT